MTKMIGRDGGAIVNVAFVNAFIQPDTGTVDYGAAKAALVNLTQARRSSARTTSASITCRRVR